MVRQILRCQPIQQFDGSATVDDDAPLDWDWGWCQPSLCDAGRKLGDRQYKSDKSEAMDFRYGL